MNQKHEGFCEVVIKMPNGATFQLSQNSSIRAEDVKSVLAFLNEGRKRIGLPVIRPGFLNLADGLSINGFNDLVDRGLLQTDTVYMAYGDSVTLVPRSI